MTCLFCGNEIGPFRIFRDDEFCCDAHRKQYAARLGKAILGMGGLAPAPPVSDFRIELTPWEGNSSPACLDSGPEYPNYCEPQFRTGPPPPALWPTVPAHAIEHAPLRALEPVASGASPVAALAELAGAAKLPPFFMAIAEPERKRRRKYEFIPPACQSWMAVGDAEADVPEGQYAVAGPVERAGAWEPKQRLPKPRTGELPTAGWAADPAPPAEVPSVAHEAVPGYLPLRLPGLALPKAPRLAARAAVPSPDDRAFSLAPAAAEREILPVASDRPLDSSRARVPALPHPVSPAAPLELPGGEWKAVPEAHAADGDMEPRTALSREDVPEMVGPGAGAVPPRPELPRPVPRLAVAAALPPSPVESAPGFPPFAPQAVGFRPEGHQLCLPEPNRLYGEWLPAAGVIPAEPFEPSDAAGRGPSLSAEPQAGGMPVELPGAGRLPVLREAGVAGRCAAPPEPVESLPTAAPPAPCPLASPAALSLPGFHASRTPELALAGFGQQPPRASAPEPRKLNTKAAKLVPISAIRVHVPVTDHPPDEPSLPEAGFIAVDFYVGRAAFAPSRRIRWQASEVRLVPPAFGLPIATDERAEQAAPPPKPEPKVSPAAVFTLPEVKRKANQRTLSHFAKIAACLMVASCVWLGIQMVKVLSPAHSMDEALVINDASGQSSRAASAQSVPSVAGAGEAASSGVLPRMRRSIADRAASSVGDTLRNGMESWGSAPRGWESGWSRNPDGYTYPGDLALFQPSMSYTDYRLEFFGQIESRGMGWVVRAEDKRNYYAMKVTIVEGGLRPIIAMVHYPVVGGVRGHSVETPLSVMVHRNTPFRVAVDVRGNHLTASIEGQRVDSWTDDLMAKGGVGFFSEAGDKSRLYWMKVLRNQDMLGTICSFLSGGSSDTASLRRPDWPAEPPREPAPQPVEAAALEPEPISSAGFAARQPIQNQGRIRRWS